MPNKTVIVGIVQKEKEILLVKRTTGVDFSVWVFPGGESEPIDTNEEDTLKREILEESNITCTVKEKIGERVHPDTNRKIVYYLCSYESGDIAINDTHEIEEVAWVAPENILDKITTEIFEPVKEVLEKISK